MSHHYVYQLCAPRRPWGGLSRETFATVAEARAAAESRVAVMGAGAQYRVTIAR